MSTLSVLRTSSKFAFGRRAGLAIAIPTYFQQIIVGRRFLSGLSNKNLVGVDAAIAAGEDVRPKPTIFSRDFALSDRVAFVTGGHGGIGLEAALALIEAGVRAVYCIDLPKTPSETWLKVQKYVERMDGKLGEGRLEYMRGDVTDQEAMWKIGETIGDREGRMDICVTAAGIVGDPAAPLDCSAANHSRVMNVNANGAIYSAQAAGKQMIRFGNGGSIIFVSSMAATVTMKVKDDISFLSYGTSKSALLQTARTMACSLAPHGIRVNTLSPGWIRTSLTSELIDSSADFFREAIPAQRVGDTSELRGVITWLSSDASSYCTGSDIMIAGGIQTW